MVIIPSAEIQSAFSTAPSDRATYCDQGMTEIIENKLTQQNRRKFNKMMEFIKSQNLSKKVDFTKSKNGIREKLK